MNYDFSSIPDRSNKGSLKWDIAKNATVDTVPLSVADMEFPTAPEIKSAIKELIDNDILGYTTATLDYKNSVCSWMKRRHNFDVDPDFIINTPGVVNALGILIEATTKPGDGVIILTPVYYPFDISVVAKDRTPVYSELIDNNGHYEINYSELRALAEDKKNTALLFCNPHNPVGRVWTVDELRKVAYICKENDVFIIDDEIHNDLIMPGYTHTVLPVATSCILEQCAICTAPSKTFNLAGLQCSNIIIPNAEIRAKAEAHILLNMQGSLNAVAYTACKAAYDKGEPWLEELISVIDSNAKYVEGFIAENIPEIKVIPLEGTYLMWLDMRELGMTHKELRHMLEEAQIYLDYGEMFGAAGRGYERINIACARKTLEGAMARLKAAIDKAMDEERPYHHTIKTGDSLDDFYYTAYNGDTVSLAEIVEKPTLIAFLRYFECPFCQQVLSTLKKLHPVLKLMGGDIKAVIQSDISTVSAASEKYPFELISDEEGFLYDRYNVFEADSFINMIAGDKMFNKLSDGSVRNLIDSELSKDFIAALSGSAADDKKNLQLPAFVIIDENMKVTFSHYSKTIGDIPGATEAVKAFRATETQNKN